MKRAVRLWLFASFVGVGTALTAGQDATATFSGAVVDQQGRGIAEARVVLFHPSSKRTHEARSNTAGRFEFKGLPAGEYHLDVSRAGFRPLRVMLPMTGQNIERNITLQVGSVEERIVVAVPADANRSQTGTSGARELSPAATAKCVPSATGSEITPPKKIRDLAPVYPPSLERTPAAGDVVLEGRLGTDGLLRDLKVAGKAHPELAKAATAAVAEWRYTPALLNCTPIEIPITITASFKTRP
jgi:hypothetical protein